MKKIAPLFLLLLLLGSCAKEVHPEKPVAIPSTFKEDLPTSTLVFPVVMSLNTIQDQINKNMEGVIYEDDSYTNDGGDNMKMKVKKIAPIQFTMSDTKFVYNVPVEITVRFSKVALGTRIEAPEIIFNSILQYTTVFELTEDWTFKTKTTPTNYKITKSPKVFGIPLKPLIAKGLDVGLPESAEIIDDDFEASFNLRKIAEEFYDDYQSPQDVMEDESTWLLAKPVMFKASKMKVTPKELRFSIGMVAYMRIVLGKKPGVIKSKKLPKLLVNQDLDPGFDLKLGTKADYGSLGASITDQVKGFTYKYKNDKKSVVVDSVVTFPQGDKLGFQLFLSGNVKGEVFMEGVPKYDSTKRELYVENLHFNIKTKNALHKVAQWMVNGPFQKKVEEKMRFSMDDQLVELNKYLKDSFEGEEFYENTFIDVQISDASLTNVYVLPKAVYSTIGAKGKLIIHFKTVKKK